MSELHEIPNLFRTVLVDTCLAEQSAELLKEGSIDPSLYFNTLKILSDRIYYRDFSEGSIRVNLHLEYNPSIDKTHNPDSLGLDDADVIYLVEHGDGGGSLRDGAGDVSWKEAIFLEKSSIVITENELLLDFLSDHQRIDWKSSILILAAAGVSVALPPIIIEKAVDELVDVVKERLREERLNYLAAVTELGEGACERLAKKDYADVIKWATDIAGKKIQPKARLFSQAFERQNKSLLDQLKFRTITEQIPAIATKAIAGNFSGAFQTAAKALAREYLRRNDIPDILWYQVKIERLVRDEYPDLPSRVKLTRPRKRSQNRPRR